MRPASRAGNWGNCIMTNHTRRDYYCSCDWLNTSHKYICLLKIILFCWYFLIIIFFSFLALQPKTTCIHFQTVYSRTWSIWRCCKFFFSFLKIVPSVFFFFLPITNPDDKGNIVSLKPVWNHTGVIFVRSVETQSRSISFPGPLPWLSGWGGSLSVP